MVVVLESCRESCAGPGGEGATAAGLECGSEHEACAGAKLESSHFVD